VPALRLKIQNSNFSLESPRGTSPIPDEKTAFAIDVTRSGVQDRRTFLLELNFEITNL
jgi:hypothetical protein